MVGEQASWHVTNVQLDAFEDVVVGVGEVNQRCRIGNGVTALVSIFQKKVNVLTRQVFKGFGLWELQL